jgi:hypothetical protein
VNNDELADIIVEVFDGVTVLDSSFGPIYVKHFHQLDTRKILSKRKIYIKEAKERGLLTEEESLKILIEDGMWDSESEAKIQEKKKFLENLNNGLKHIQIPSKREQHRELIKLEQIRLAELSLEREKLVGLTAEKYVDKKVNKEFFEELIFVDEELKISPFEDIDYDDFQKIREISNLESSFFKRMSDDHISRAVLSPFFSPYLPYAEDVLGLFGEPLKDLTAFQLKLLTYARSFLNIFKNSTKEIPENVAKDPELLIDFFDSQKNANKQNNTKASDGDGGTTYFGANKKDIEQMKQENQEAVVLEEEIKKKGGSLNMKELMELHGL